MLYLEKDLSGKLNSVLVDQKDFANFIFLLSVYYMFEYEYVHRKLSNFGLKGMLLNLAMGGRTFVSVKIWYPMKEKVGQEFFHARKKLYRIYDSYQTFE